MIDNFNSSGGGRAAADNSRRNRVMKLTVSLLGISAGAYLLTNNKISSSSQGLLRNNSVFINSKSRGGHHQVRHAQEVRESRRLLSSFGNFFHDPRTVELRYSNPKPNDNNILSYKTVPKNNGVPCVSRDQVIKISQFVNDLQKQHHIRIFPRNGLLLGIIRHGGFLPVEGIDTDFGIMFSDIQNLPVGETITIGDYTFKANPSDEPFFKGQSQSMEKTGQLWGNWNNIDPMSGQPYPFLVVDIKRGNIRDHGIAVYPYHNGQTFFPRLNLIGVNHLGQTKEMLRWNTEEANMRYVDTDELVTETNYEIGKQIGTVFPSSLECMVEKQFYFTKILVPCDYEAILQAQYGSNWKNPEPRTARASRVIPQKHSDTILKNGPRPLCSEDEETEDPILPTR